MRIKAYLYSLLVAICALSFSGCKEEEPEVLPPALELLSRNIDATAEGGVYSIQYQLENPVEGAAIEVENTADWISGINTAKAGTIEITVAVNPALEARTATLKVTYPQIADAAQFTVKQAGAAAPTLKLEKQNVEAEAQGGSFVIKYTLTNPRPEGTVSVRNDAGWITDVKVEAAGETEGQISFNVAANESTEVRSAELKVSYTELPAEQVIAVSQAAAEEAEPAFTFEIKSAEYTTAVVAIYPQDKTMKYFASAIPASEFEAMGGDDAVFQNDIDAFQAEADEWGESLSVIIGDYVMEGDQPEIEVQGLMPGIEYVFYAYGIDVDQAQRLTDVEKAPFAAKEEKVNFAFDIQVTGTHVDYTVDPKGYDGYYYADIFNSSSKDELTMTEALHSNWENTRKMYVDIMGMSIEDFLNMKATKGVKTASLDIEANVERALIAYALDSEGRIVSRLTSEFFTTGDAIRSELELTIDVTGIKAHKAHLTITPSNEDSYTYVVCKAKDTEGLHTDKDIINYLMQYYSLQEYTGVTDADHNDLQPDSEYVVYAFGYHGFAATTDVFQQPFRTEAAGEANIGIVIATDKYYDSMRVADLDAGYAPYAYEGSALMPIIPESDPEGADVYWILLNSYSLEDPSVTDETIMNAIANEGESGPAIYLVTYGMSYRIFAYAEDAEGNRTKLWKGEEFTPTNAGVSDPAEFVAEYPSTDLQAANMPAIRK